MLILGCLYFDFPPFSLLNIQLKGVKNNLFFFFYSSFFSPLDIPHNILTYDRDLSAYTHRDSDLELWILFFNREDILYDRWQMNLNKSKT